MSEANYFKVRIESLHPSKPTTFDLYVLINGKHRMYLRAGDAMGEDKIQKLAQKDQQGIFYVQESERSDYKAYLHSEMQATDLTVKEKARILRESSMSMVEELYEHPDVHTALNQCRPMIDEFIQFMDAEPDAMAELIGLSSHDFYTYNHSLDVSIYSLGLGNALSYNQKDLTELGLGSLFHDVGKRHVNLDILCKKGGLDDIEWEQMRKHPQFGLMILNDNDQATEAIKACCFEHHESFSGNGYPQQLEGDEIHPMARIVAIADTYDAMTTQRSYNVPLDPVDAVTMMKEKLAGRYDPDMLKAMYSVLFKLKAS